MRSLQEVHHLNSLWVGDKTNYKGASRQPLRRRRGDVHGDLSAAVLQLQWEGVRMLALHMHQCCSAFHCQLGDQNAAEHWSITSRQVSCDTIFLEINSLPAAVSGQDGAMSPAGQEACRLRHSQSATTVACYTQHPNAAARWAHLRMHFITFPRAARQATLLRWCNVVNAALQQPRGVGKDSAAKLNKRPTEIHVRASSRDLDAVGVVSVSA